MRLSFFCLLFVLAYSCSQSKIAIDNIEQIPPVTEADQKYANVYQALDGHWKGTFYIYIDTALSEQNPDLLYDISKKSLQRPSLKLSNSIEVTQVYASENPYFQKVTITDFYPSKKETITSTGVNKVQNGKMWCVVHKPDETIIHEGSLDNSETIIWQRDEQNPQRKEYFRETVLDSTYTIIGWGYYEGDDPQKMPKYWFYGNYKRQ